MTVEVNLVDGLEVRRTLKLSCDEALVRLSQILPEGLNRIDNTKRKRVAFLRFQYPNHSLALRVRGFGTVEREVRRTLSKLEQCNRANSQVESPFVTNMLDSRFVAGISKMSRQFV